jgi:hypothetical protein
LRSEFLKEHLATVSGTLLLHLSTLLIAENNGEQIKTVLSAIAGVLLNTNRVEESTSISFPPTFPCDDFDESLFYVIFLLFLLF